MSTCGSTVNPLTLTLSPHISLSPNSFALRLVLSICHLAHLASFARPSVETLSVSTMNFSAVLSLFSILTTVPVSSYRSPSFANVVLFVWALCAPQVKAQQQASPKNTRSRASL